MTATTHDKEALFFEIKEQLDNLDSAVGGDLVLLDMILALMERVEALEAANA